MQMGDLKYKGSDLTDIGSLIIHAGLLQLAGETW